MEIEKLSVIIPAYNESADIIEGITETAGTLNELGFPWEIIVTDDGSADDTYEKACTLIEKYGPSLIVIRNKQNLGKGAAIKEAITHISGDHIVFLDADMELHPSLIATLVRRMESDNSDVVIGSKLHPESTYGYPGKRKFLSYAYYFFVKALFGLPCRDTQTGIKLFNRKALLEAFPKMQVKRFAFDLELLTTINILGFKITEAPVVIEHRRDYRRINFPEIMTIFKDTMTVFYRQYILRYYDREKK